MIKRTFRLAHDCAIIVTDQSDFITCELRTDGERFYAIKHKISILDKHTFDNLMNCTSNSFALVCNKIIKISHFYINGKE